MVFLQPRVQRAEGRYENKVKSKQDIEKDLGLERGRII